MLRTEELAPRTPTKPREVCLVARSVETALRSHRPVYEDEAGSKSPRNPNDRATEQDSNYNSKSFAWPLASIAAARAANLLNAVSETVAPLCLWSS